MTSSWLGRGTPLPPLFLFGAELSIGAPALWSAYRAHQMVNPALNISGEIWLSAIQNSHCWGSYFTLIVSVHFRLNGSFAAQRVLCEVQR